MDAYELGDVEVLIWNLCDGTNEVEDIAARVATEYDVATDVALKDAITFLGELSAAGLVE